METDDKTAREESGIEMQDTLQTTSTPPENGKPVVIEPDLDFIRTISKQSGNDFKKCMQCGTCSATCELSPDLRPFPGKEMAWAAWGMKDRLLEDPDVWLCYQCNDCSARCPRSARPGDVLAAVRQAGVAHWSFPRFIGRWVNQPKFIPLLLAIPILLLTIALYLRKPIEDALGIIRPTGENIIYAYSGMFPHWLIISFFFLFSLLVLVVSIAGILRFWKAINRNYALSGNFTPAKSLTASIISTLKNIITHNNFTDCTRSYPRFWSHVLVFFGHILSL